MFYLVGIKTVVPRASVVNYKPYCSLLLVYEVCKNNACQELIIYDISIWCWVLRRLCSVKSQKHILDISFLKAYQNIYVIKVWFFFLAVGVPGSPEHLLPDSFEHLHGEHQAMSPPQTPVTPGTPLSPCTPGTPVSPGVMIGGHPQSPMLGPIRPAHNMKGMYIIINNLCVVFLSFNL